MVSLSECCTSVSNQEILKSGLLSFVSKTVGQDLKNDVEPFQQTQIRRKDG